MMMTRNPLLLLDLRTSEPVDPDALAEFVSGAFTDWVTSHGGQPCGEAECPLHLVTAFCISPTDAEEDRIGPVQGGVQ